MACRRRKRFQAQRAACQTARRVEERRRNPACRRGVVALARVIRVGTYCRLCRTLGSTGGQGRPGSASEPARCFAARNQAAGSSAKCGRYRFSLLLSRSGYSAIKRLRATTKTLMWIKYQCLRALGRQYLYALGSRNRSAPTTRLRQGEEVGQCQAVGSKRE